MTRIPPDDQSQAREFQDSADLGGFRNPCADMESDVSALLDRELDQSGMRRVLVHLEICPKCRAFLDSIRSQVTLHQGLWSDQRQGDRPSAQTGLDASPDSFGPDSFGPDSFGPDPFVKDLFAGDLFADDVDDIADDCRVEGSELLEPHAQTALERNILQDVRERVGEVLYQLGRAYVILARAPHGFRIIAKEPVPVPEYRMRGKALLDGASTVSAREASGPQREGWAEARDLLDGRLDQMQRNFDKGRRLLEESLAIRPESLPARITYGLVLTDAQELEAARANFERVLEDVNARNVVDPVTKVSMRVYALESLGTLFLTAHENERALGFFEEVRASGAMKIHSDFSSCLMNIAVASLRLEFYDRAARALEECYRSFPSRRRPLAKQLAMHKALMADLGRDPVTRARLATSCPLWFGSAEPVSHGQEISFYIESFAIDDDAPPSPSAPLSSTL